MNPIRMVFIIPLSSRISKTVRHARKENPPKRKVTDITLLKTIAQYPASVVGSPVSIRSITAYLISGGRKVSPNTVDDYVEVLTEAFVFYPAERFDIVGKQLLKINKKMYIVDLGLRNHILPRKKYDPGFSLENMVCFELLIVLTADHLTVGNYNGIHVKNLSDRLLEADR